MQIYSQKIGENKNLAVVWDQEEIPVIETIFLLGSGPDQIQQESVVMFDYSNVIPTTKA